ncbi:hypothetical protein [Allocoleopsis sp.]|uniref:hypothetical protein n=1 Tax=Allocoleopsis sp. TaxID=3088169 RepID=UPI002FD0C978
MRETVGSLKAYFIVVAVFGFLGSTSSLSLSSFSPLFLIVGLIGLVFSIAYFYIGISIRKLLVNSPNTINNVILASMAYQVINFLLTLLRGLQPASIISLAIGLLITWYLLNSVNRLASQERSKTKAE